MRGIILPSSLRRLFIVHFVGPPSADRCDGVATVPFRIVQWSQEIMPASGHCIIIRHCNSILFGFQTSSASKKAIHGIDVARMPALRAADTPRCSW
jgi:hypothetical protein